MDTIIPLVRAPGFPDSRSITPAGGSSPMTGNFNLFEKEILWKEHVSGKTVMIPE